MNCAKLISELCRKYHHKKLLVLGYIGYYTYRVHIPQKVSIYFDIRPIPNLNGFG